MRRTLESTAVSAQARGAAERMAAILLVLGLLSCAPVHAQEPPAPDILRNVGLDQKLNEQLPLDAVFRDEGGREVRLGDYFGKRPVIVNLTYFECPMLCTLVLNGLVSALDVLHFDVGKEFEVVTISFDPREGPALAAAKKQTYLQRYRRPGAEAGWHFLTGGQASIERVAKAIGFRYAFDPQQQQYAHAAGIVVATPPGRVARYFYGVEYAPRDLRLGLVEASEGKIGSPVDQFLLFCYHYDPRTGRYGAVVMNIVRLAGALTILVLGGFIALMLYRDAGRKQRPPSSPPHGIGVR